MATTIGGSQNFNLWEAENPLDIYLLIVILVALVPAALSLLGDGGDAPMASMATALLAGVGTLLILYQIFDTPGDLGRKIGLFLGLIACAGDRGRRLPVHAGGRRRRALLNRFRLGELVGALSGLGLLVVSFLPWYSAGGQDATAWQAFSVVDLVMAAAAIAGTVGRDRGVRPDLGQLSRGGLLHHRRIRRRWRCC